MKVIKCNHLWQCRTHFQLKVLDSLYVKGSYFVKGLPFAAVRLCVSSISRPHLLGALCIGNPLMKLCISIKAFGFNNKAIKCLKSKALPLFHALLYLVSIFTNLVLFSDWNALRLFLFQAWVDLYSTRRYGRQVPLIQEGWNVLYHTIYNCTDGAYVSSWLLQITRC